VRQLAALTSGRNWGVVEQLRDGVGREEGGMDLTAVEEDVFSGYLAGFTSLAGDARTRRLVGETVRGIIGAESLCCARIAAFSPGTGRHPAR
jgi:hypothetical protein